MRNPDILAGIGAAIGNLESIASGVVANPSAVANWRGGVARARAGGLFQSVGTGGAVSAAAGLGVAYVIPRWIVRDPITTGQKLLRVGVAAVAAVGAGMGGRAWFNPEAGKMAFAGGIAGTLVQALEMFTNIRITKRQVRGRQVAGNPAMYLQPGASAPMPSLAGHPAQAGTQSDIRQYIPEEALEVITRGTL